MEKQQIKILKSACRMCHGGCGVLVYLKDGQVIDIKGDPDSPLNRGKICIKAKASIQHLYNPHRLKYPLKRTGERGERKWARISWDEALDTIVEKIGVLKDIYGPETIVVGQGTGRHHFFHVVRFANVLGTPNWMEPGTAQCFVPRLLTGIMTYGGLPVCDYYGEVNPATLLVWGHNPLISGADGEIQFRVRECLKKGTKLIVVDPRKTELASRADLWMQIRPGTDDALALSLLHVMIKEGWYHKEFVQKWTLGFDELKKRVKKYPPEWAEKITWIPKEKIREAARMISHHSPMTLEWGVALEHTPNCLQTVRAVALIPAITGNIDIPGGWNLGMQIMPDANVYAEALPVENRDKRLGADTYKVLSGKNSFWSSAHVPTVFQAMRSGEPYPVKALLNFGNNALVSYADSKEVYKTLRNLEFILAMDLYMTPTTELADIILPAASWLEHDGLLSAPTAAPFVVLAQQKVIDMWECRSDEQVLLDLAKRLQLKGGTETLEEILNQQLMFTGMRYKEFEGITFEQLKERGFISVPITYKKYEKSGFLTGSGKVELRSTYLESLGYDPLPYYQEPPESPVSQPKKAKEYPLILITGGRSQNFFHSEYRQIKKLREQEPEPQVEIHPETAEKYHLQEGEWTWIETSRGRIMQKAKFDQGIHPGVVNVQHGWWYPEKKGPEYGVWKSNANVLTDHSPPYDPAMGTYQLRALLCKVYPVTSQNQHEMTLQELDQQIEKEIKEEIKILQTDIQEIEVDFDL